MFGKLMRTTAAGALIIGVAAIAVPDGNDFVASARAQTQEEPATMEKKLEKPAEEPAAAGEVPMDADESIVAPPLANLDIFVIEQGAEEVAASRYLGRSVLNTEDETVGDINDLIFAKNGGISAAVIGVGGFLGIGEKAVAVRFDSIDIQEDPEFGSLTLIIDATKEQLEQAPPFVTKAELLAEARRRAAQEEMKNPVTVPPTQDRLSQPDQTGTSSITQ